MLTDAPEKMAAYADRKDRTMVVDRSGDAQGVMMNQAQPPFDNSNARKALVYATDPASVADSFGDGLLQPTDQPISELSPYHVADPHYLGPNLDLAKKAAAQYTAETGSPLKFKLLLFAGAANLTLGQLLQAQWAQAGIDAQLDVVDESKGISDSITGQFQAELGPNFGFPDPDNNYFFWHSSFIGPIGSLSINFPHFGSPELDKALDDGRASLDPKVRKDAYATVTRVLNDNAVYVWLYRYADALIARDDVRGLRSAEESGFASINSKPWYQNLWLTQ
jgi:ABC-type transport system substrate-binding protein